jgi:hypothetical protein
MSAGENPISLMREASITGGAANNKYQAKSVSSEDRRSQSAMNAREQLTQSDLWHTNQ